MAIKVGDVEDARNPQNKMLNFIKPGIVMDANRPQMIVATNTDDRYMALESDLKLVGHNVFDWLKYGLQI